MDVDGTMFDMEATFYLGDMMCSNGCCDNAIVDRCSVVWAKFSKPLPILTTRHLSPKICSKVYVARVRSAIIHWSMVAEHWDQTPLTCSGPTQATYSGCIIREVSMNSAYLYEASLLQIKGFTCFLSHHSVMHWFLPDETKYVFPTYSVWKTNVYLNSAEKSQWIEMSIKFLWKVFPHFLRCYAYYHYAAPTVCGKC